MSTTPASHSTAPSATANRHDRRAFLGLAAAGLGSVGLAACSASTVASDQSTSTAAAGSSTLASGGDPAPSTTLATDLEQSGYIWTDARMLWVATTFDNRAEAESLIPPNLTLAEPLRVEYFVARYPLTNFGSVYNEAAVFIAVDGPNGPGWHCPWMVVDDDTALIYGRELLGFPKKMAVIDLVEGDDTIVGTVSRKGTEILRVEAPTASLTPEEGPVFSDADIYNAHGSVVGGMHLLYIPKLPEEVHERETGPGTVTTDTTDRDPLGRLGAQPDGDATFTVLDFAEFSPTYSQPIEDIPIDWAFEKSLERAL